MKYPRTSLADLLLTSRTALLLSPKKNGCGKKMKQAITAGLMILGSLLAPAATVVDLNLNLSSSVTPARAIDVNTSANQTYNWSSSAPLFDGPVTNGNQNTKIYGAFSATGIVGTLSNATVQLDNSALNTILFRNTTLAPNSANLRAVAFWDAADFLVGGNTRFDASSNSSLTIGVNSWLNASGISGTRYVIRDGTNYYVSSFEGQTAQNTTNTIYGNTAGLQWSAFDITNWATYSESDANLGLGTLTFSAQVFNNVTGVGLLGAATRGGGNPTVFQVADFQASLVAPLTNAYTLTVTGGSGSGVYTNGAQIPIAAFNTPYQTFVRWTGDTQYVANVNASNTTVTMPTQNIALAVTFSYFTPSNWPDMHVPRYSEQGSNYAAYPLVANATLNPTFVTNDLSALARHFDCLNNVKGNFTLANANYLYGQNTNFQVVAYINESHTGSMFGDYGDPWKIEQSNRTNVLYYQAGNLGVALPATTNSVTFAVSNLFSSLVASTAAAGSNVTYTVGSTYYFVTWLKLDGELMRIETATNDTINNVATVTVKRAFDGTTVAAHTNNTPVLVPVYFKSGPIVGMTNSFEYYNDPGAPLMAQDRLADARYQYTNYNRGIWEDICGSTLNCLAMGGESLSLDSSPFWNIRKNHIYTSGDFSVYTEEGINFDQTNFFALYGKQLVIWANNLGNPTDFANNPRVGILQSTPFKPRPVDAFSLEASVGSLNTTTNFSPNSYSKWGGKIQATMFLGENKLAAMFSMIGAGSDNSIFSAAADSMRHYLFLYGYASYLLAVKVEANDLIYSKFGMNPLVGASSAAGYYQLDPIFLYPIGRPTETLASTNYLGYQLPGLTTFMRQFENGLILVNPGDDTNVTDVVALSRPYFDPEVSLVVTQVMMAAKSGRILLNPSNSAPVFTVKPISRPNAGAGVVYSNTIAGSATDVNGDPLTYSKISGPLWLSVSTNGTLSGTPSAADVGTNVFTVKVADPAAAFDTATLNIVVLSAYTVWANQYQLVQGPSGNDDGDRLSNLYEFGLGGNPTNSSDLGYPITFGLKFAGGTNWLEYVYPKRSDPNSGLLYYLQLATNLATPVWTNSGYTVTGSGPLTNGFLSVTNRIETNVKAQQFIRLIIEMP